jgi:hypothetical protein
MTYTQSQAIWELCRQGLPLAAYEAEAHWESGKIYRPQLHCKLSRESERIIERCNREARETSKAHTRIKSQDANGASRR